MSDEEKKKLSNIELVKDNCIFCKIANGEIESYKIYEDDKVIVILDINPISDGHTLIIPKEHYMIFPLVPEDLLVHISTLINALSNKLKKSLGCNDLEIFIANGPAAGQQSNHFMIHLIPKYDKENIVINMKEITLDDRLKEFYKKIMIEFEKKN